MQPYATSSVSLGSAEEPYDPDMTHSYRLAGGRLIRYPLSQIRLKGPPTIHQRFMYEIFHGLINLGCHQASEAYLSLA